MAHQLINYTTRSVPRYTSYPTAPHFRSDFEPSLYGKWLGEADPDQPISLYIHVPFCRKVCWYCGCNMKLAARYEPIAAYIQTLSKELELVAESLPSRMTISHLHWGGGTPTALEPFDLERVMLRVRELFNIADDAEIAIESDPRTLTKEMITMIGKLGFNRASFGIQEFDPKVQLAINRVQPPEMVRDVVSQLRAVGVSAINFDLIYGLPFQTVEMLKKTIEICNEMNPNRISLFGYAHVPWMAKRQNKIDQASLPGAAERLAQAESAANALTSSGYTAIGLDHFARPDDDLSLALENGTLRRNFQGYTTDSAQTLIGIGASSIGKTAQGYVQNITETGAWSRAIEAGILPVAKGLAIDEEDQMRAQLIESILCYSRVNVGNIARKYSKSVEYFADEIFELKGLRAENLVDWDGEELVVRENGRPLLRVIAAVFDAYLATQRARHSTAV